MINWDIDLLIDSSISQAEICKQSSVHPQEILPHLGPETDACMSIITANLMSCLGSHSVILRKTTVHILQIYLRFSSDVQAVLR